MQRNDADPSSPLRALEGAIHGELGPGSLAVVMARAGVGKTAFIVQVGLDEATRERDVLHIALGQTLDHVHACYESIAGEIGCAGADKHRVIHAFGDSVLPPDRLGEAVDVYCRQVGLRPTTLLIDGYDWQMGTPAQRAAELEAYKALGEKLGAKLWMTAQTHRSATTRHPTALTPPCDAFAELIDVAIFLEPQEGHVAVRLLKDHAEATPSDPPIQLDCDTLRLVSTAVDAPGAAGPPPSAYTLLSGGASGAEAAFGAAAERWGVKEVTFSFAGRACERAGSVVELSEADLQRGEVSLAYVESHMHRSFPKTPAFQKTLQTIWHQVQTAGQVFVIGQIQPDGTVRGGTGWAAELARHFKKPLHVFDQSESAWFGWDGQQWKQEPPPRIARTRFAGTGTRDLSNEGEQAIRDLFERSFGPAG